MEEQLSQPVYELEDITVQFVITVYVCEILSLEQRVQAHQSACDAFTVDAQEEETTY